MITVNNLSFNSTSTIFLHDDNRSLLLKTVHLVISLFRQALYLVSLVYHHLNMENRQYCGQNIEWSSNSQGLVVLLHGLRNDPAAWHPQLSLLNEEREIDIFAPVIPKRGMCSLIEAATPILPTLLDYIARNPQKPICILGVSNGSRIATWLETQLRQSSPLTPVMVSTIAGVHLGSTRMDLLKNWGLANCLYPEALQQELAYRSPEATNLLNQVCNPLPSHCAQRKYEFYATTEDLSVPDLDSSLPQINKGERFYILHGHSHDSIVSAVARHQIFSCLDWIRNRC